MFLNMKTKNIALITNSKLCVKNYEEYADIFILEFTKKQKNFKMKNTINNIFASFFWTAINCSINKKNTQIVYFKNQNLLFDRINKLNYKYVILVSCGTIINKRNIDLMNGKLFNIHPSYLPYFPGLQSLIRSIFFTKTIGLSIHNVSENIDKGKIIYQNYLQNINFYNIKKIKSFYQKEKIFILKNMDNLINKKINIRLNKLKLNDKFKEYSIEQPNLIKYIERLIFIFIIVMFLKNKKTHFIW